MSYFHRNAVLAIVADVLALTSSLVAQNTIGVPADRTTIQAAIDASQNGDTVLVSPGTYAENINFEGKAINLTSLGGAANTIIDGGAKGTVVTFSSGEGLKSVLNGFTIRNGWSSYAGGGIEIYYSSPSIIGNIITDNHAVVGNGIDITSGSPLIKDNTISANTISPSSDGEGGGIATHGGSPVIIGNKILNNVSTSGGGIDISNIGRPTIQNNLIAGNTGGNYGAGIAIQNYDGAIISQNLIINNSGIAFGGGVSIYLTPKVFLVNNVIVGNVASDQTSGIYVAPTDVDVDTIANNIIVVPSGNFPVFCDYPVSKTSPVFVRNDFFDPSGSNLSGSCNLTSIPGNFWADPQFVNAAASDFHLQRSSPAIDAGDNSVLNLPQQDKDGNARVIDGNNDCLSTIDTGVYELQATAQGSITPTSLVFTDQLVGTAGSPQSTTISSTGSTCLLTSSFNVSQDFTQTNTCGIGVPAGSTCSITVRFQPTAMGLRTGTLNFLTNSSSAVPSVALSGTGVTGAPSFSPTSVSFGNVVVGSKASQTVTLKANSPVSLAISSINVSAGFTQSNNCPVTLKVGSSCKITVSFKPTVIGAVGGFLSLSDNGYGTPQSIALSGVGVKKH
jgi:hypothetical protein